MLASSSFIANGAVAVVLVLATVLVAIFFVIQFDVFGWRSKRVPRVLPAPFDDMSGDDSPDSVMRALSLVQHRYAALSRRFDAALVTIEELQAERDHWKRQALDRRAP